MAIGLVGEGPHRGGREIAQQQAVQRLNTLTAYAQNTDSLQLGEQFDVGAKQWVSAFPLTWSEAGYVSAALEMGGF